MGAGNCVLVSDIEENLEAIGDAGVKFTSCSTGDLAAQLKRLLGDEGLVRDYRVRAAAAVREKYDWEQVTDQYEALYRSLMGTN